MGELEARKLKYPTTGTEALLMGILIEGLLIYPFPKKIFICFGRDALFDPANGMEALYFLLLVMLINKSNT